MTEALPNIPMTFYTGSFPPHTIVLAPGKRARGGFMHRCGSGLLLTLVITFVAALTGCLGKSSTNPGNGGVASVTLSPGGMQSLEVGRTLGFTATATDANGRPVLGVDIQFTVASGNPNASAPLSLVGNGSGSASACAGTWDPSLTQCNPGTSGIALVTAVSNGFSSTPTYVYVHQHVDSIQISRIDSGGPPPQYDCFSQGQTWLFEGTAYSNGLDITNTVGPMSWSSSNSGVVTAVPYTPPGQQNVFNQVQTTAKAPGITQLFASVSGTTSSPQPYTTCLVQYVRLQIGGQGPAGNSITVNNGASVSITATAVDTVGFTLPVAPLTWSTTNPEVAAFSATTNTTGTNSASARNNLGGATLTASCTPPTCNIGLPGVTPFGISVPSLPIYASDGMLPNGTQGYGTISVDVTSTSAVPTYTAWAATTDCNDALGCSSALFSVTPSPTTPIATILSLPRTPNSMMFNHVSTPRVYLGSKEGLMYVDVGTSPSVGLVSSASTPCNVSVCGQVLAISNDGKLVAVSDTVSTPSQVYIYNGSGGAAPVDLALSHPGEAATAAAFSPDQLKLFILTNAGNMYVYSTVDGFTSVSTVTPGTDVEFSADGSFAYVAGAPASSVSAFSTCSLPGAPSTNIGTVATSSTPLKIFPSPVLPPPFQQFGPPPFDMDILYWTTQTILALEPPNIEFLTAEFTQIPLPMTPPLPGHSQFTCNPPSTRPNNSTGFTAGASFNLGQGNFTPVYAQLVADGTEMIIVARKIPAVLLFDVSNGTVSSVTLGRRGFSTTDPLAAAASTDGSQVYIAACDQYAQDNTTCTAGSVHIVNTCGELSCNKPPALGLGDFQQVPYVDINNDNNPNMCNSQGTNAPLCLPNLIAIKPQ
ncbi:MAG: hypothetical protein ACHP9V_03620 [Terriglobales bacterium]